MGAGFTQKCMFKKMEQHFANQGKLPVETIKGSIEETNHFTARWFLNSPRNFPFNKQKLNCNFSTLSDVRH